MCKSLKFNLIENPKLYSHHLSLLLSKVCSNSSDLSVSFINYVKGWGGLSQIARDTMGKAKALQDRIPMCHNENIQTAPRYVIPCCCIRHQAQNVLLLISVAFIYLHILAPLHLPATYSFFRKFSSLFYTNHTALTSDIIQC